MGQSDNTSGRQTQSERIEALLRSRYAQWIPAYELSELALQYCARINQLRKKLRASGDAEQIENQTQRVNGQVHGSYRICRKAPVSSLSAGKPSKSWDEIVRERERKLAAPETFGLVP